MSCDYDLVDQIKTNKSDLSSYTRIVFEDLDRAKALLIGCCKVDHQIGLYRNLVDSELGFFCEDCELVVAVHRRQLTSEQESCLLSMEGHQGMVVSIKQLIEEDTRSAKERMIQQIKCLPDTYSTVDILSYLVDIHSEG